MPLSPQDVITTGAGTTTSTSPVAAYAQPPLTNAAALWKQQGISLGQVRHPLDLPLRDPKLFLTMVSRASLVCGSNWERRFDAESKENRDISMQIEEKNSN
jgi:hypothetical protein